MKQQVSGRSGMGKRGAEFTTEPLNPTSRNAFKYSGLANPKAVDVTPIEGGVQLVMKTKNAARAGKPLARVDLALAELARLLGRGHVGAAGEQVGGVQAEKLLAPQLLQQRQHRSVLALHHRHPFREPPSDFILVAIHAQAADRGG